MLYMKVIDAHWLAFGTLASLKLNGENHRTYAHNMAVGQWYFVLRESLINFIQTTTTAKTLGVALGGNCGEENALQEQRDRCPRLLALAINGFRADSLCGLPSSFLTAWSNNVQPCEVSEKISIFSCRWKSAMTG